MRTLLLTMLVLLVLTVAAFGQGFVPPQPAQPYPNPFSEYSPANPFGVYGNPFSEYSPKNPFGVYGNPYSDRSPLKPFSQGPEPSGLLPPAERPWELPPLARPLAEPWSPR